MAKKRGNQFLSNGSPAEIRAMLKFIQEHTKAEVLEFFSFKNIAEKYWTIPTKNEGFQPFRLRPAQIRMENEYERQMDERGWVRLNILKCRQVGCTSWIGRKFVRGCQVEDAVTALTVAHRKKEPTKWLKGYRKNIEQTPPLLTATPDETSGHLLSFANGSSYSIDSVEGGFPGMGDTIQRLHLSEMGRWDKPPVSKDPEEMLTPLIDRKSVV